MKLEDTIGAVNGKNILRHRRKSQLPRFGRISEGFPVSSDRGASVDGKQLGGHGAGIGSHGQAGDG